MTQGPESERRSALKGPLLSFSATLLVTLAIMVVAALLQGQSLAPLASPGEWLRGLDSDTARDALGNAADVVAAVLSIAITVVAIVVELAANRYSHRITWLFVREWANIVIMTLFVVTTLLCVWVSLVLGGPAAGGGVANAGFAITMVLVTLSLLILLPYFAFVFAFLSPLNIIRKLRDSIWHHVRSGRTGSPVAAQVNAEAAIDELQDVARRAIELSDRSVAMTAIGAMADLVQDYQDIRESLPEPWFRLHTSVAEDPDFVALAESVLETIERDGTWMEVKIMRQYLSLMNHSVSGSRDTAYLIAIRTKEIAILARARNRPLLELCIQCINSYLRAAINGKDPRTTYYVLDQYRKLAEQLMRDGDPEHVIAIARHVRFYGLLGYQMQQPFLLEVAAYDIAQLITLGVRREAALVDPLLELLIDLDREIRAEPGQESLAGVRRAQLQVATLFALREQRDRLDRVADALRSERPERLVQLQGELMAEERPDYWEFTDRGVNFSYLPEEQRRLLPRVLHWLQPAAGEAPSPASAP